MIRKLPIVRSFPLAVGSSLSAQLCLQFGTQIWSLFAYRQCLGVRRKVWPKFSWPYFSCGSKECTYRCFAVTQNQPTADCIVISHVCHPNTLRQLTCTAACCNIQQRIARCYVPVKESGAVLTKMGGVLAAHSQYKGCPNIMHITYCTSANTGLGRTSNGIFYLHLFTWICI